MLGRAARRVVAITVFVVLGWRPAFADNVDALVQQLGNDDSDKVRLSAALSLTKLGTERAILPMAKALLADGDKNVRSACAVGLSKIVTARTSSSLRNIAVANLKKAAAEDESDFVKAQAQKALAAIGGGGSGTPQPGGGGGIYVNIGPMSSKTGGGDDPKLRDLMRKTASKTMGRVAGDMAITWPGGDPKKADLDKKGVAGFYVDGTLNELAVKQGSASSATVSCKISMLLASFPDKSVFGFLNGGASVQSSGRTTDLALAREDCVSAVVEDLIAKKIVPTIKAKAGN